MTRDVPASDTCDTRVTKPNPAAALSEAQLRFLDAYRQSRLFVAPAAKLAGVHRSTVYRWQKDPAFAEAMRQATERFFREHRAKVLAQQEVR